MSNKEPEDNDYWYELIGAVAICVVIVWIIFEILMRVTGLNG